MPQSSDAGATASGRRASNVELARARPHPAGTSGNGTRFTQPDPSGHDANPYAYSSNDPINQSDTSGLWPSRSAIATAIQTILAIVGYFVGPAWLLQIGWAIFIAIVNTVLSCWFGCRGGIVRTAIINAILGFFSYAIFGLLGRYLGIIRKTKAAIATAVASWVADRVISLAHI